MTSISKNMYNDKLYEVVKKYNNKYHRTIKIKSDNEKSSMYIDFNKKIIRKVLNLELVVTLKYQNIKIFLRKVYTPDWFEEVSVIKNVENAVPWTYVIDDHNEEETVGTSYEKELQKIKSKRFQNLKINQEKNWWITCTI